MKDTLKTKASLFVELTPEETATISGGAYWNRNRNQGGGGSGGGSSSDSP